MPVNRIVFPAAFAIGLAAIAWVGAGFVGTSAIALAMTAAIAVAYLTGAQELRRFRNITEGLAKALAAMPAQIVSAPEQRGAVPPTAAPEQRGAMPLTAASEPQGAEQQPAGTSRPRAALDAWLERVPASLREPVRLRIEGERTVLPGPALTPYLVGLLVMLGMLGTFLGLVVTFKGTVLAVEGSADLQAMRTALAAPIKGLGLAFGTSVAGVAASAMLGLMSATARRERMDVARRLDAAIATALRPFSPAHQREETLRALQAQAQALPVLVDRLQTMMDGLERRGQQLDEQLLARQGAFHREAASAYTGLASSVGESLKESLATGARMAGESVRPVIEHAMAGIAQDARQLHQRQVDAAQAQLQALTAEVVETLTRTQAAQAEGDRQRLGAWTGALESTLAALRGEWERVGSQTLAGQQALCDTLERSAGEIAQRASADASRTLQNVRQLLARAEELVGARIASEDAWLEQQEKRMDEVSALWRTELASLRDEEAARAAAAIERLDAMQAAAQAGLDALQEGASAGLASLQASASAGLASLQAGAAQTTGALQSTLGDRLQALESTVGERLHALQSASTGQLAALQATSTERLDALRVTAGDALSALQTSADGRLAALQAAVAQHLATLGTALEAPMTRLLETASEAPRAAAEVIAQLRQEMSSLAERDRRTAEEHAGLARELAELLKTIGEANEAQRAAIGSMAQSATQLNASGIELASLGEAFQHGVQLFSASNEKLLESLQRIEGTLARSIARSDEQLAYYVAQAREVVDLSVSAQQGILEDLRRLRDRQAAATGEGV